MQQKNFLVYLHSIGVSQSKLHSLFTETQNYGEVFEGLTENLLKKYHFLPKQQETILEKYKKLNTDFIDKKLEKEEIEIIDYHDKEYPSLLRQIANPPYIIYLKGKIPETPCFAVIGSRNISPYGKKCIEHIVPALTQHMTIVSGGAFGCDSLAHEITLKHAGNTLIVIGTGIDKIYPASNASLYKKALENDSGILSIFPLGEPGNAYNFPQRNEIISGLSLGTLVIEAGEKSGTLITAQLTLDQGRDLFSIPGDIFHEQSFGCNTLLKSGQAKLVAKAEDILEEYHFSLFKKQKVSHTLSSSEQKIYDSLSQRALSIDEIAESLEEEISSVLTQISFLELKKVIKKNESGKYEIF